MQGISFDAKKVVGQKQAMKAVKDDKATTVYIALDAESRVTSPVLQLCSEKNLEVVNIETMKELGKIFGIEVGAAVAAVLK